MSLQDSDLQALDNVATTIRDETVAKANSATRVGAWLVLAAAGLRALGQQLDAVRTLMPASPVQTGSYTLAAADAGQLVPVDSASPATFIIPSDATQAVPTGFICQVSQEGPGQVTVAGGANVDVKGLGGGLKTPGQYGEIGLRKVAANTWRVTGGVA